MPKTLIAANPTFDKKVEGDGKLSIAEMFIDTLQGEGISSGVPSTFIRLKGCTLDCVWCDTASVWREGNEYSFDEIFELLENAGTIEKLTNWSQHLILTGGSPLKQQEALVVFIHEFIDRYGVKPYIEVENEAVLMPSDEFASLVDQWNNSPKLANSGMKPRVRIKQEIIKHMSKLPNAWFKFVVSSLADWEEIARDYMWMMKKSQVILMPEGMTQEDLGKSREMVANLALEHGLRFTDRLHVTIWNKKTGV